MNKRGKYILQIPETESFANALSKARRDVEQLEARGGETLDSEARGGMVQLVDMVPKSARLPAGEREQDGGTILREAASELGGDRRLGFPCNGSGEKRGKGFRYLVLSHDHSAVCAPPSALK